jgi:hypothetical protein
MNCSPVSSPRAVCSLQRRLASWQVTQQALRSLRFQLDTLRVGAAPLAVHLPC